MRLGADKQPPCLPNEVGRVVGQGALRHRRLSAVIGWAGELAAGEKELDALLLPRLGSNDFELVVPTNWYEEPVHPFVERFSAGDGKLSLNRIFEHGLTFADSRSHAGLQLVDVVAYVVRKAIVQPDNDVIYAAYSLMRENLRTERRGQALRLVRYTTGQDALDEDRYRTVL